MGMQNEKASSQTKEEQIYKELYFTSQGRFPEQVQDSLVGVQPWGWEGGMGRLLYSLTWAAIDLHWSMYLSHFPIITLISTKAESREGPVFRDPTY